jgi:hypothetical protein
MKNTRMNVILLICIVAVTAVSVQANDPTEVPWPVGSTLGEMNETKTLMNGYGDRNNGWDEFHGGIDIDNTTGFFDCKEVRCVDDGYATIVEEIPIPGTQDETQWIVIICDELGGAVENGWSYAHFTQPSFPQLQYVAEGQLIGYMHDSVLSVPHAALS